MGFPESLKQCRKERDMSQHELARRLGVSPSLIHHYEAGTRKPSFEMLVMLSDFFDRDLLDDEKSTMPTAGTTDRTFDLLAEYAGYTVLRDEFYNVTLAKGRTRITVPPERVAEVMRETRRFFVFQFTEEST